MYVEVTAKDGDRVHLSICVCFCDVCVCVCDLCAAYTRWCVC